MVRSDLVSHLGPTLNTDEGIAYYSFYLNDCISGLVISTDLSAELLDMRHMFLYAVKNFEEQGDQDPRRCSNSTIHLWSTGRSPSLLKGFNTGHNTEKKKHQSTW